MGRWTQYDGDDYRLPDGFKRVGYDADRAVYTFKDSYGRLYEGYPHQEYGTLKPIGQSSSKSHTLYEKESSTAPNLLPKPRLETTGPSPKSFSDILSPDKITSASPTSETTKIDPKSRFVNAVWRATRPKMQNVVENVMKRSTASREADKDSIYEKLLPDDRRRSSDSIPSMTEHKSTTLTRSSTSAGHGRSHSHGMERSSTTPSRSSSTSSRASSTTLVRSATSVSSSSPLLRAATTASSRTGGGVSRSSTSSSRMSMDRLMRDLPTAPSNAPVPASSRSPRRSSSSSSPRRRAVEAA